MKRIAIIGGIGSGKSEVLKVAKELGLSTLSADEINAELLKTPDYIAEISKNFPTAVEDGAIVRQKLADIVFSDGEQLKKLNSLAHPRILKVIKENKSELLIVEMPLLLECGAQAMFDETVLVYAPLEKRLQRLALRGLFRDDALKRINAQSDESALKEAASIVLDNSGALDELKDRAKRLFYRLCQGA